MRYFTTPFSTLDIHVAGPCARWGLDASTEDSAHLGWVEGDDSMDVCHDRATMAKYPLALSNRTTCLSGYITSTTGSCIPSWDNMMHSEGAMGNPTTSSGVAR